MTNLASGSAGLYPDPMAKPARKREDFSETARRVVDTIVARHEQDEKPEPESEATAQARRTGAKGGKSRAAKLTPERRSEIARKAAAARWARHGA